jgi:D-alanyl-D-alanine carboxypeptidase-like protein
VSAGIRGLQTRAQPIVRAFLNHLAKHGISARITSTRRSPSEQAKLYAAAQSGKSRFPAAPPGRSTHATGLAFDVIFNHLTPPAQPPYPWPYEAVGQLWESLGYTWGGRFGDPIHFDFRRRT